MTLCGRRPLSISVALMQTTRERTNMLCETCGAEVLIERRDIAAERTFVRDQRLVCQASPKTHAVWQGFR